MPLPIMTFLNRAIDAVHRNCNKHEPGRLIFPPLFDALILHLIGN
jgi:hypothetical protein